jgi:hypothetical protein
MQVDGDEEEEHVTEGLETSNMNRYELTSIERLLDTLNSSWLEGKGQEKPHHELVFQDEKACCGGAAGLKSI